MKPILAKVVTLAIAGSLTLVAVAGCTSTSSSRGPSPSGDGDRVAVLITGTAHEPRRMLTAGALQEVRTATESTNVTDGPGGKGSSALVTTAEMPIVPIPEITSVTGPSGTVTTLPDALLGFGPESAVLSPAAAELIGDVAADIPETSDSVHKVNGHTPVRRSAMEFQSDPTTVENRESIDPW